MAGGVCTVKGFEYRLIEEGIIECTANTKRRV
jgi:hypothetical protein